MKQYKTFLLIIFFTASFFISKAQQNDSLSYKLDEYLTSANQLYKFNGSALIAQHGHILLQKSYGYKNVLTHTLNDSNTIFQIGSVTKQFSAAVVLELQEERKLSVHGKLSQYFPQFKYADQVTLDNLLTHTSGIYNYTGDIDEEDSALVCNPVDKQPASDVMFRHHLDFKPGTEFSYDNPGYYLLGLIIEKVTGKSYEQNVRNILFTPLQMTHSLFDFKHSADTNIATGYQTLADTLQKEATSWRWDSTVMYAAGAIWSTTGDMYKWAGAIAGKKILSAESWKAALTPHREHYGYGLYIDSAFGKPTIRMAAGYLVLYLTYVTIQPETLLSFY